ncbi:MAG TPA: hypothetical protein VHH36_07100 [Candidatus Thermoplasmatota archaeon]|nr:hypothetical protein [Candidatus Thermoplasmatota archaeon]
MTTKPTNFRLAPRLAILGVLLVASVAIAEIPALESAAPVGTAQACSSARECAAEKLREEVIECIRIECWAFLT